MIALRADLSDLGYANISGDAGDRPLVEGVGGLGSQGQWIAGVGVTYLRW
jgi:hypothetical protein